MNGPAGMPHFPRRARAAALAVVASIMLHAAVIVGMPDHVVRSPGAAPANFEAIVWVPAQPAHAPQPAPRAPRPRPRSAAVVGTDVLAALPPEIASDAPVALEAPPELLALAQPAAPGAPSFPVAALPPAVAIEYELTSAIADGRATYRWERDGDTYRIRGEAEAEGLFALFLSGRIVQESRGTVGPGGLRPERFTERRPNAGEEGLTFDWPAGTVSFERNGRSRTAPLAGNTVDWLSMIFQLAHVPPASDVLELQVYTQRKMYRFRLQVLGVEQIEIPLGRVRALRLRHEDPGQPGEIVDVWLGVDQHYLPVKMRYPAARNRLVVEQAATRIDVAGR